MNFETSFPSCAVLPEHWLDWSVSSMALLERFIFYIIHEYIHVYILAGLFPITWLLKDEEAKLDMAQASPVLACSNRLVTGSFSHPGLHGSSCVVVPLAGAENLQRRRQTCWQHLPLFLSFLPSLHPSLATSLLNLSLPFLSSASIFPSLLLPALLLHLASSLLSCFLASRLCPITGMTAVELSKHSLRCWSTLHTVMCLLCTTQDVVRMTLLGWHVSPEDIMFTLLVFTGKRHLHQAWNPTSPHTWTTKYLFVTAFQKGPIDYLSLFYLPPLCLRFVGNVGARFWHGHVSNKKIHISKAFKFISYAFKLQNLHTHMPDILYLTFAGTENKRL